MIYHIIGFVGGFIMDLILGDPYSLPHPIRWIGQLIGKLDEKLNNGSDENKRRNGFILVTAVVAITVLISSFILLAGYRINSYLGMMLEVIMTYQLLATKSLKTESMKVYDKLCNGTIDEARYAVSMIVGRDTKELDYEQIAKAAVETVAENTSDGIIAPMLYACIGGPVLGFAYKAINTMDSMVGYKNDKYMNFGFAAAKLDDIVNFIPARISAVLMLMSTRLFSKEYNYENAVKVFRRDRLKHASPNSAQTEAVCAGALGLMLAGPTSYFGKTHNKPYIGDELKKTEARDIIRANRLLYQTAFIAQIICIMILVFWLLLI